MPEGNPLVGEVWEMRNGVTSTRGVIADVTSTVLTLVSFTGNRLRVAPDRLLAGWTFSQAPPPTALRCNRRGCPNAGILKYQRGTSPEWVCPRHIPVGVQASITTESLGVPQPVQPTVPTTQCPGCRMQVEIEEDARLAVEPHTHFQRCPACNIRWATIIDSANDTPADIIQRVTAFRDRARTAQVTVDHIMMAPQLLPRLEASTGFLAVIPAGIPQTYTLYGIPVSPAFDLPGGVSILIRTRGTPAFPTNVETVQAAVAVAGSRLAVPVMPDMEQTFQQIMDAAERVSQGMAGIGRGMEGMVGATETVAQAIARALRTDRQERDEANALLRAASGRVPDIVPDNGVIEQRYPIRPPVIVQTAETVPGRFGTDEEVSWDTRTQVEPPVSNSLDMSQVTPYLSIGQKWVQRKSGSLVEITRVVQTESQPPETAIHFKRVAEGVESSSVMLVADFIAECRVYTSQGTTLTPIVPSVIPVKDEEWEHVESGEVVVIDSLDTKRDLVIVAQKSGKRRSVPLHEFYVSKWRKIIRRTAYDRLLSIGDDD